MDLGDSSIPGYLARALSQLGHNSVQARQILLFPILAWDVIEKPIEAGRSRRGVVVVWVFRIQASLAAVAEMALTSSAGL